MQIQLEQKIKDKSVEIAVIGLGYVGLPLAVELAKCGFHVTGIDTDRDRVSNVKNAVPYILDVDIEDIKKLVKCGCLTPSADFRKLQQADVIIICVPTPLKRKYQPNINYIKQAVRKIKQHLRRGQLIILESTTYPGTTDEVILPILEETGLKCGEDFFLVFSPERIDPGNQKFPLDKIPKVVGGVNEQASDLCKLLYEQIIEKVVVVSSPRAAETVKLLENTFRLVNIGLVNELSMMCHKMNLDIWEIIDAARTKPFGFMPFYPGPGVGGHCIPKDPLYLYWKAKLHGFKSRFIKLAADLNSSMPAYIVERLNQIIPLKSAKILVLGVTYKKDIKDLRKSPALEIIDLLKKNNAHVFYADPLIPYLKFDHYNLKAAPITARALAEMDCCLLVTDHSGFDYELILQRSKLIFDTRNAYKGRKVDNLIRL
ncbi:MAG: UDP-N-acetyl-D-glucosamine dehydrogenase [Omnitrophica WOR_2 bacterium RIFCSPHIGHO2_02_FULL_45_21]|nr:MAG: UDP-N-acetyl-D-glucosamine dehydrogenase [Omnitrophica WOR_2 bacterium RIFCSPHIGHO2_02_FULL_45_21]